MTIPPRPVLPGQGACVRPRDYGTLLALAGELQFYNGYLNTEGTKQRNELIGHFDEARRKFVYELCFEDVDADTKLATVLADLDEIAAQRPPGDAAVEHLRGELPGHVLRQANSGPLQRFVTRWAPITLTVLAGIAGVAIVIYLRVL